jgi:hypothetical protein
MHAQLASVKLFDIIISVFIPELQVFEILTFFLVDSVYGIHKSVVIKKQFPYFRTVYLMLHVLCAWYTIVMSNKKV